ncbi:MAG: hypothetical protein DDT21_02424 [Syntrophomonadaceae bacterium]|nr:hypothetical protein [Bacillota bacterium]
MNAEQIAIALAPLMREVIAEVRQVPATIIAQVERTTEGGTRAVSVRNVATRLLAGNAWRSYALVQNLSGVAVEIGFRSGLVLGQGIRVSSGQAWLDESAHTGEIYAVAATAGPHDVRVAEVTRRRPEDGGVR